MKDSSHFHLRAFVEMLMLVAMAACVGLAPRSAAANPCLELSPRGCGNPALGQGCVFAVSNKCDKCTQGSVATVMLNGHVSGRSVKVPPFSSVEVKLDAGSGQTSITQEQNCPQPKGIAAPPIGSGGSGGPAGFHPSKDQGATNDALNGGPPDFQGKAVQLVPFLFNGCDSYVTANGATYPHSCCTGDGTEIKNLRNPGR